MWTREGHCPSQTHSEAFEWVSSKSTFHSVACSPLRLALHVQCPVWLILHSWWIDSRWTSLPGRRFISVSCKRIRRCWAFCPSCKRILQKDNDMQSVLICRWSSRSVSSGAFHSPRGQESVDQHTQHAGCHWCKMCSGSGIREEHAGEAGSSDQRAEDHHCHTTCLGGGHENGAKAFLPASWEGLFCRFSQVLLSLPLFLRDNVWLSFDW